MIRIAKNQTEWDGLVEKQGGHPLQLWAWGELKAAHGPWRAVRLSVEEDGNFLGAAQILVRRLPAPFGQLFYVPRGPFCTDANQAKVLRELVKWAKQQGGVGLKIEPAWRETGPWTNDWRQSANQILLPKTAILDLGENQANLLAKTSKKTRQYIRKSEADQVKVRAVTEVNDIAKCLKIYQETAARAGFALHDDSYYQDLARLAGASNRIYLAEKDGVALSFLWNLRTSNVEFELYGGANDEGQRWRSNYALKWAAISRAQNDGVQNYDLNGLLNDGISNFKRGFSNQETEFVGTWDLPLSPLYHIWETALPVGKKIVRNLKNIRGKS